MRVVAIRERSVAISRYGDPSIPSGGLTASIVAVLTDVIREGGPVAGFGFSSLGRFAQSGLIRERFAPRLLNTTEADLADDTGTNFVSILNLPNLQFGFPWTNPCTIAMQRTWLR